MKTVKISTLALVISAICAASAVTPAQAADISTNQVVMMNVSNFLTQAKTSTDNGSQNGLVNQAVTEMKRLEMDDTSISQVLSQWGFQYAAQPVTPVVTTPAKMTVITPVQETKPITVKAPVVLPLNEHPTVAQQLNAKPAPITIKPAVVLPLNEHPTVAQQLQVQNYGVKGSQALTSQIHGDVVTAPEQMHVLTVTQSTPVAVPPKAPVAVPHMTPTIQQKTPEPLAVPPVTQKTPEVSATAYRSQVEAAQAALVKKPVATADIGKVVAQGIEQTTGIVNGKVINETVYTETVQYPAKLSEQTTENDSLVKQPEQLSSVTIDNKIPADHKAATATKPAAAKPTATKAAPAATATAKGNAAGQHPTNERHNVVIPATMISAAQPQQQPQVIEHYSVQVADRATQRQVDSNSQKISKLNSNFSNLKSEVESNKKEAAAGASAAMAQANIPQVLNGQTFAVGAGVGGYDGESSVAVGVSFRASENVTVKATVSDDTQQNIGYGAGVSVGW